MRQWKSRIVLGMYLMFIAVGGLFFYYENNPQVYNTIAEAGLELNILDNLGKWEGELSDGKYFTFVDENGSELDQTVHAVFIGDEIIAEDNNRYKVVSVDDENNRAVCKLVGLENIVWQDEWDQIPVLDVAQKNSKVAIYMTHNDESYVPTDGTESKKGNGGILQVGKTMADTLEKNGVNANISYDKHDPHDANAYHRSRKTAVQLLKSNPIALIDVHRDGVPDPEFYNKEIDGKPGTKIRLVVGRQNPHMSTNLEFAKQIKAYFDKKTPGLIKGIFMAKGSYNQDLGPRAILIEVGTHTNSREAAERGVAAFAEGIPKLLGATTAPAVPETTQGPASNAGAGRSIIWLVAFVILGGGAFLLISTGSMKGSLKKLTGLGREFSSFLGPIGRRKKKDENNQEQNQENNQENNKK